MKSNPPGIFDKNALAAVGAWQYAVDPAAKPFSRQTTEITFTLADAQLAPIPLRPMRLIYPAAAQQAGVMGNCNVGFWIEENGTTSAARILSCSPSGYFERATLDAVNKTTYRMEAEARLNHRRYHTVCIKYRFNGFTGQEASYLKPGQWIKLRFTRTINGRAKDITVVSQSSPGLPTGEAIEQLRDTNFAPIAQNGKPIEQSGNIIVFSGDTF